MSGGVDQEPPLTQYEASSRINPRRAPGRWKTFSRVAPSPILKMLAGTALTSLITTAIIAVVTGTLAARLGPDQFGSYMLARRFAAILLAFCTLSMGVAIPRYVAMAKDDRERKTYLLGGFILGVVPSLILWLTCALVPATAARLLLGSIDYRGLLFGTLILLIGSAAHGVLYGYYRGLGRMDRANAWQLFVFALAPIVIVYGMGKAAGTNQILVLMGLAGGLAFIPLIYLMLHRSVAGLNRLTLFSASGTLFHYGYPRIPSNLALQWILALGPFLAFRFGESAEAGYLLAGQVIFQVVDVATGAFGIVLLPKVAALQSEGRADFLRERINDILAFVLHMGLFASLQLQLWARPLILTWLGPDYLLSLPLMRIMLAAVIPYMAYVMLRSIVDGIEHKPVNTINLSVALLVTAIVTCVSLLVGWGPQGLAAAIAAGFWVLAILTVIFLWRRFGLSVEHLGIKLGLLVNLGLLVPSIATAWGLRSVLNGIPLLMAGAAFELVLLVAYCTLMWRSKVRWAMELALRLIAKSASRSEMA